MNSFWKGSFSPQLRKHRLWTGDIENHIQIFSIEYEVFDENTPLESKVVYISAGFIEGEGSYSFEEEIEEIPISDEDAMSIVVGQLI